MTEGRIPLSFAQQRLWFLDQLDPGTDLYNVGMTLSLEGPLDLRALRRSLDTVVDRHAALRSIFPAEDGKPWQIVLPPRGLDLTVYEVPALPARTREEMVQDIVSEEAERPFDLAHGPLVRARLLRLSADRHMLVLVQHHIVTDGWSLTILLRELGECYRAFRRGKTPRLPDLPIQYPDHVLEQRSADRQDRLDRQLAYWRSRLEGARPLLELPTDRPRPPVPTYRGASEIRLLPADLVGALTGIGRRERATLFMVLLAAYQVLLSRYTGRLDIVVGTPTAGRASVDLEALIGLFINTLALRADLSGDPTFRELLARVRAAAIGAFANADLPFERLVEALQPERSRQHAPLVQVLIAMQNTPPVQLDFDDLTVRRSRVTGRTAKFDLSLVLHPENGALRAEVEYGTDLFDAPTITRLLDHYETLLQSIAADPGRRLSALPFLTEAERRRLLVDWNPTGPDLGGASCVHQLIEARVERAPEATAIVCGAERLSYRELDQRANRLANHLRALGVGPEARVALAVARTPELVVGVLGILKAGGAYLPLDPAYPAERLRFMLADSGAAIVVTTSAAVASLGGHAARVVWLERDRDAIARERADPPPARLEPDHLAYVIYTSGSSGTPKGVAISHRALAEHCASVTRCYDLRPSDRILQFSDASWDASLEQMLPTLLLGTTIVLRGPDVWTPAEFKREVLRAGVTAANLPTAYVDELVREWAAAPELAPSEGGFRLLEVGGEALRPDTVRLLRASPLGSVRLVNAYGPTEATITAVGYVVPQGPDPGQTVPIGRPLAGRTAYVLDRHLIPVPIGVAGELYLGGASLARCYLGRPALTAERFVPDPFGGTPGARLYRTGDVVRYRPDGNLEFFGRLDQQVKLRGYRIEMGEIEASLDQSPEVRQSVVLAREDVRGDRRLVAYVVSANPESPPRADDLRDYLRARLPAYMVPASFVCVAALPLTPQGKVNRQALPAPEPPRSDSATAGEAPRTAVEQRLAGIWAEVLGVPSVGIHDDFFALGGHSLLATQVVSLIRRTLAVELPLSALFEAPSLSELAKRVEAAPAAAPDAFIPAPIP